MCKVEGCVGLNKAQGLCGKHYHRLLRHGNPFGGRTEVGVPLKYMEEQLLRSDDECFVWPFANDGKGYGIICFDQKNYYVHRISCERANGPAPENQPLSRHLCGNGHLGCFNPKHLIWSNQTENMSDRIIHETTNRGERHGNSKLTEKQVMEIFVRSNGGEKERDIAKEFGITASNVYYIKIGKSWSWLTSRGE